MPTNWKHEIFFSILIVIEICAHYAIVSYSFGLTQYLQEKKNWNLQSQPILGFCHTDQLFFRHVLANSIPRNEFRNKNKIINERDTKNKRNNINPNKHVTAEFLYATVMIDSIILKWIYKFNIHCGQKICDRPWKWGLFGVRGIWLNNKQSNNAIIFGEKNRNLWKFKFSWARVQLFRWVFSIFLIALYTLRTCRDDKFKISHKRFSVAIPVTEIHTNESVAKF